MKRSRIPLLLLASSLSLVGCYEFVTQITVSSVARSWTGANSFSQGNSGGSGYVLGLAGDEIHRISGTGISRIHDGDYAADFGGPYTLTSVAQTHTLGWHEHTFVHGNLVGSSDNLNLFRITTAYLSNPRTKVRPWLTQFTRGGTTYEVREICEIAANPVTTYGDPWDANAHLYMSFRACQVSGSSCTAGVMEISVSSDYWWPESIGSDVQVWIHKPNGTLFSNECMPFAVTQHGSQSEEYLVVGDPSMDEISVFDAFDIAAGPIDSLIDSDSSTNIRDITIEGRGESSNSYGFIATLRSGSSSARIEHNHIFNGVLDATPFLSEAVPTNLKFIASRGRGLQSSSEYLYTFGSQVMRRSYQEE
ncbi:hypothetical protein [Haliangium ochraceum]|uniref:Lipoprotein n=1 Tax=Haliangium ochraceum (strain DSM 14365 / JCM 11303 / SMP-2) TaxID=502025 RepID=D0LSD8_HALO1|nr:hypothetical protein [Haliangium ochraceum]ACY15637.1 hypothetical protein Hoch_3135 [Haliangium ochraceum DSM 14365]